MNNLADYPALMFQGDFGSLCLSVICFMERGGCELYFVVAFEILGQKYPNKVLCVFT